MTRTVGARSSTQLRLFGVFSSRKIATACERNLAFLTIVGDDRPDFRTLSDFRKIDRFALADLFTQVLKLAHEAGRIPLSVDLPPGK
jgi:transposase